MNTVKQEHTKFRHFFQNFKQLSLDDFNEHKMSLKLYSGKNPVVQL